VEVCSPASGPLGACSWPWAWTRITLSVKARACRSEYVTVLPV
jgi:hypothetical protein